jgi:hypothetical protein
MPLGRSRLEERDLREVSAYSALRPELAREDAYSQRPEYSKRNH